MILAVVLGPALDLTFEVDHFRVARIHRTGAPIACGGGKGLNMARAAHLLGAEVSAIALLGGHSGRRVADLVAADGVACRAVPIVGETRTCVSIASGGELTELYENPTPVTDSELDDLLAAVDDELATRPHDWLAVSGGSPGGMRAEHYARLVEVARRHGVRVAVDSYGPALTAMIGAGVDLVKINRSEALDLLGLTAPGPQTRVLAEEVSVQAGCPAVVTDGEHGAAVCEPGSAADVVPAPGMRGSYPVGSGDSFLGGLLTGLVEGCPLADAVRLGAGAGTANAMVPGQGRFDPELARSLA